MGWGVAVPSPLLHLTACPPEPQGGHMPFGGRARVGGLRGGKPCVSEMKVVVSLSSGCDSAPCAAQHEAQWLVTYSHLPGRLPGLPLF